VQAPIPACLHWPVSSQSSHTIGTSIGGGDKEGGGGEGEDVRSDLSAADARFSARVFTLLPLVLLLLLVLEKRFVLLLLLLLPLTLPPIDDQIVLLLPLLLLLLLFIDAFKSIVFCAKSEQLCASLRSSSSYSYPIRSSHATSAFWL
jgi:hypothetical protein